MTTPPTATDFHLDDQFISRLETICQIIGTKKQAAQLAGISEDMLHRYIRGDSKPSLQPIAKLCAHTGKSMDWLIFGKEDNAGFGPSTPDSQNLRLDIMEEVIEVTEEWLDEHRDALSPKKKALLMREVYEELLEKVQSQEADGHSPNPKDGFGVRGLYKRFKTLIRLATA